MTGRLMSYVHVWSRSVWLLACPVVLSYDWQMRSVPLVSQFRDHRNLLSAALLTLLFYVIRRITSRVRNVHLLLLMLLLLLLLLLEMNAVQLAD